MVDVTIQMGTEEEKGSVSTAVGPGSVSPKRWAKPVW